MEILLYPFFLLKFWYVDVFSKVVNRLILFNKYILELFSFRLLIITFFRPLKNEYRQGLIGFSVILGILVKTFLISFTLGMMFFLLIIEVVFTGLFLVLPFLAFFKVFV